MKNATEIVVVMDKSTSMGAIAVEVIGGFNKFLKEQRALPDPANLTLVLFDTAYSIPINGMPIAEVPELNSTTYRPGGCTALLDGVGRAIVETGSRLAAMGEDRRPEKVIVVVITDGEENSSVEHKKEQIAEMVKHQEEKYDWCFIFMGANVDAFHEAAGIGIQAAMAVNYSATPIGTRSAMDGVSKGVSSYRSGGKQALVDPQWKDDVK